MLSTALGPRRVSTASSRPVNPAIAEILVPHHHRWFPKFVKLRPCCMLHLPTGADAAASEVLTSITPSEMRGPCQKSSHLMMIRTGRLRSTDALQVVDHHGQERK